MTSPLACLPKPASTASPARCVEALVAELFRGAGFVLVTEEALLGADLRGLSSGSRSTRMVRFALRPADPSGRRASSAIRTPALSKYLGNVTFLERPFHPTTLVSLGNQLFAGGGDNMTLAAASKSCRKAKTTSDIRSN